MENATSYGCNENAIEWLRDQRTATLTITQQTMKNRIMELAEKYPEDVKIVAKNRDGSICARVPRSWVKINPPKQLSAETLDKMRQNLNFGKSRPVYRESNGNEEEG